MKKTTKLFLLSGILLATLLTTCKKEEKVRLSKVIIGSASVITETTAMVSGEVIDVGDNATAYGHCWSTNSMPTVSDNKKDKGGTVVKGKYTTEITGLSPDTKYYAKAYVMEGTNAVYSDEVNFTTKALSSTGLTTAATEITGVSVKLNGIVNPNGESADVSFEWGTSTAYGNTLAATPSTVSGYEVVNVSANLTGLDNGTTYHFRVKVVKSGESNYGGDKYFTTDDIPTVSTDAVTNVTHNSATMGGNVISNGGDEETDYGVCWGKSANPTINGNHKKIGDGTGSFSSQISGLEPNTKYYVRAYATNNVGTAYGPEDRSFTTKKVPSISVTSPTGNDHWIGEEEQLIRWETTNVDGNVNIILYKGGAYQSTLFSNISADAGKKEWIVPKGTIYARDYRIRVTSNSNTNLFGESTLFTLSEETGATGTVSDIHGTSYATIKIGKQWWMAENLKSTRYSDGALLTDGSAVGDISGDNTSKYYFNYDNNIGNVTTYGRLYTWAAAMNGTNGSDSNPSQIKGVCPDNWHLPSDSEWQDLEIFLGMSETESNLTGFRGINNEGGKLKTTGTIQGGDGLWDKTNAGATDEYKFKGIPSGFFYYTGSYWELSVSAYYWSTSLNGLDACVRALYNNSVKIYRDFHDKAFGFSVRCIKD